MDKVRIAITLAIALALQGCSPDDASGKFQKETAAAPTQVQEAQAQADKALADAKARQAEVLAFDPYRPFLKWEYMAKKDAMTDQTVSTALKSSDETVDLPFPYSGPQSATLLLRQGPGDHSDVYIRLERGQLLCHESMDNDGCQVRVRIDGEKPFFVNGNPPDDRSHAVIFLPEHIVSIKKLSTAKVLKLELPIYEAGTHVFTFNIDGLDMSKLEPGDSKDAVAHK